MECKTDLLALCCLLMLAPAAAYADDGCTTCQNCWNAIMDCATNGTSSCTNCVQFSPEECSNFVSQASMSLSSISNDVYNLKADIPYVISDIGDVITTFVTVSNDLVQAQLLINDLQDTNSVSQILGQARARIEWILVRSEPVDSDGGSVVYTNRTTGVARYFRGGQYISTYAIQATNLIHDAISGFNNHRNDVIQLQIDVTHCIESLHSLIGQSIEALYAVVNALNSFLVSVNSIDIEQARIAEELSTVNCSSCSKGTGGGSSSGGGSGSGSGGTIDFTPLQQIIQDLKDSLEYLMGQLYNLLSRYYTDYNAAADSPSGGAFNSSTYSASRNWFSRVEMMLYPLGSSKIAPDYDLARATIPNYGTNYYGKGASQNNWFMRIEQLLGMIADPANTAPNTVGDDVPTEPPEELADTQRVQDLGTQSDRNEENSDSQKRSIDDSLRGGWQTVSSAFTRFVQSLRGLGVAEQNIDGLSLELTYNVGDDTTRDPFIIPQGTSARLSVVRTAFNVVWLLLCAVLYIYAFKLFFGLLLSYIAWFLQLAAATFGS